MELELLDEIKIRTLLGNPEEKRFEASGVCVRDGECYIIFDNSSQLLRVKLTHSGRFGDFQLIPLSSHYGYEDIAYDARGQRFFILIESKKFSAGRFKAQIEEYDNDLNFLAAQWADFTFKGRNKGLEGLACLYLDDELVLLGLCEGNKCQGGAAGQTPGHGRIQVFQRGSVEWQHLDTIRLPKSMKAEDYSGLDVKDNRIAVVSQASSLLWLGNFQDGQHALAGEGTLYQFPKNRDKQSLYCNIEGVAWLTSDLIVAVSDKRKSKKQAKRCRRKDQSLHIFRIPPP